MRCAKAWLLAAVLGLAACASTQESEKPVKVDVKATQQLAESSYAAGDWAAAAQHYTLLLREMPQDADMWFRLANACARSDQPDRAIAAYREVLVRDSTFSKAWFNMGIVQLRQAANSFLKMDIHVAQSDPMHQQAALAYDAILKILGEGAEPRAAAEAGVLSPASPKSDAGVTTVPAAEDVETPTGASATGSAADPGSSPPAAASVPAAEGAPDATREDQSSEPRASPGD